MYISEEKNDQKRLLRRSLRRVANFFICLNTNLIFWIYCTPKTLRCRKGRMQDLWDVGKEVCRKGVMHEKRDTGKEGSRKEGFRTGGIQERWDLGLQGSCTGGTQETRDTENEGYRTRGIQD